MSDRDASGGKRGEGGAGSNAEVMVVKKGREREIDRDLKTKRSEERMRQRM